MQSAACPAQTRTDPRKQNLSGGAKLRLGSCLDRLPTADGQRNYAHTHERRIMKDFAATRYGRSFGRGKPSMFWAVVVTLLYGGGSQSYWGLVTATRQARRR